MNKTDEKHPGAGKGEQFYSYRYYMLKYNIGEAAVRIALRQIRYGTAQELESYPDLVYNNS